jgi:ankyrin repeat protein
MPNLVAPAIPWRRKPMNDLKKLIEAAKTGALEDVRDVLHTHAELIHRRDEEGATALHYAALGGHREIVQLLIQHGADVNALDGSFGATPAGWAIEYLREMDGFLGIELDDFAFAIRRGDVEWVKRFLKRFPSLLHGSDPQGNPFKLLASQTGNPEIIELFE